MEFETIHVGGKGPRGMAVRPLSVNANAASERPAGPHASRRTSSTSRSRQPVRPASGAVVLLPLTAIWVAVIVWASWRGLLPRWSIPVLGLVNLATFYLYWWDKYAAGKGHWRTTESSLHLWGLIGGWPAAWLAQQLLRHKTSKESFRSTYRACVGLHCAALTCWLLWASQRDGLTTLRAWF